MYGYIWEPMSAQAKRNDRSHRLWLLAYAALTFATLSGLFAMHGLPMKMPGAGTGRPAAMSVATADMAPSDALADTALPPVTQDASTAHAAPDLHPSGAPVERGRRATVAGVVPMASVHGGCDATHDGCLATLRAWSHSAAPVTVAIAFPAAVPARPHDAVHLGERCLPPPPPL